MHTRAGGKERTDQIRKERTKEIRNNNKKKGKVKKRKDNKKNEGNLVLKRKVTK